MSAKLLHGWCRNCMAWVNIKLSQSGSYRCASCSCRGVESVHDPLNPPQEIKELA